MRHYLSPGRLLWPAIALAAGVMIGGLWPQTPLHAVATDSNSFCVIATGAMDPGIEAIYVLDSLTGELRAAVLSRRTGMFRAQYQRNISEDFKLEQGKKAQFLMVTGRSDLVTPPNGIRFANAVVYVAETNSGVIRGYAAPWVPQLHAKDQPAPAGNLIPLGAWRFRAGLVRDQS